MTTEKTNDQDQLALLKSLIPEFGKRPIYDIYQPPQKYLDMYSQAYASVKSILPIVDETNISKYQGLNVVLKNYITLADLIFNTHFKTEQQLGQLQDRLTDVSTVLTEL